MPIALRKDFDADSLRAAARKSRDGEQARRLLALAAIYDGAKRIEAAKIGGVTRQIVRDWVVRFNAQGPRETLPRAIQTVIGDSMFRVGRPSSGAQTQNTFFPFGYLSRRHGRRGARGRCPLRSQGMDVRSLSLSPLRSTRDALAKESRRVFHQRQGVQSRKDRRRT
jgi:hypothetical protein